MSKKISFVPTKEAARLLALARKRNPLATVTGLVNYAVIKGLLPEYGTSTFKK